MNIEIYLGPDSGIWKNLQIRERTQKICEGKLRVLISLRERKLYLKERQNFILSMLQLNPI